MVLAYSSEVFDTNKNMARVSILLYLDLKVLLTSTRICSKLNKSDVLSTEVTVLRLLFN
jgi:hypothetical protein